MRRHVDLTFSFDLFYYGLIDIWPIFDSGPSVLRVFLTVQFFPFPPPLK